MIIHKCPECGSKVMLSIYPISVEFCPTCNWSTQKLKKHDLFYRIQEIKECTSGWVRSKCDIENIYKVSQKTFHDIAEAKYLWDIFLWLDSATDCQPKSIARYISSIDQNDLIRLLSLQSIRYLCDKGEKNKCTRRNITSYYDMIQNCDFTLNSRVTSSIQQYILSIYEEEHGQIENSACFESPIIDIMISDFAFKFYGTNYYIASLTYINNLANRKAWIKFKDKPYKEWLKCEEYNVDVFFLKCGSIKQVEFEIGTSDGMYYDCILSFSLKNYPREFGEIKCLNSVLTQQRLAEISRKQHENKFVQLKEMYYTGKISKTEYLQCHSILNK